MDGQNQYFISTKRIETLVDGIFAIAMTLLVLSIKLPDNSGLWTDSMVWGILWGQATNLFIYALSFYILATLWINHHRVFDQLKIADHGFWWITVLWLLLIALVPFSTYLMGDFGNTTPAALFFQANMFLIGIVSLLNRWYVIENKLADKIYKPETVKQIYLINLVFPVSALIGMSIAFISPPWSPIVYLFSPLIIIYLQRQL
ncbi:MAG TPA: TMEM175 family protein [Methanobacteriaceae archaeon]|nr:TMEM175 family protein [Methanobacteriaceae archaeon]